MGGWHQGGGGTGYGYLGMVGTWYGVPGTGHPGSINGSVLDQF